MTPSRRDEGPAAPTGTAGIDGWRLAFAFADGQKVTNMWGGTPSQDGGKGRVSAASTVPAKGSVTVGFTAAKGEHQHTAPTGFTLDGAACATS
ncbi:cellulose binding domain-containing protein [Streptomyces sp. NPDC002952]|uniref:cellulose binding domain-containing protein n=1 Tax=Streptomyces sp. NPDC002952 TaxID=3364673 RepID=UPI0036CC5589